MEGRLIRLTRSLSFFDLCHLYASLDRVIREAPPDPAAAAPAGVRLHRPKRHCGSVTP